MSFLYNRTKTMQPPTYGSLPAVGEVRTHASTGAEIRRMADGLIVYSRYTPINTTNKYIFIHGENSTSCKIYDYKTMALVRDLPTLGEVNELRWDYDGTHYNRFFFVSNAAHTGQGMQLNRMNAKTGVITLDHDFTNDGFTGATYIANDVEGDSSSDSRYWAFMAMATPQTGSYYPVAIFTYDRVAKKILGRLDQSQLPQGDDTIAGHMVRPNMVEISPDGTKCVIHWNRAYAGANGNLAGTHLDGPHAYPLNLSLDAPLKIGVDATHSGWGIAADGKSLFVHQNNRNDYLEASDLISGWREDGVGVIRMLSHPDMSPTYCGMHFAKSYVKKGYVLVSTYNAITTGWGDDQLFLLPLTANAMPLRVAPTYNLYPGNDAYRNECPAAMNHDGTQITFTANWGDGNRARGTYSIALPINWETV